MQPVADLWHWSFLQKNSWKIWRVRSAWWISAVERDYRWWNRCKGVRKTPHRQAELIQKKVLRYVCPKRIYFRSVLEAWYPLLIMSAAIICVFMNSSFSSVPRRLTYAILRNKSCCFSGLHNKTSINPHVFVYAVPTFLIQKKNIPSHLGAQKAEKHTWIGFPQLSSPALWRKILENLSESRPGHVGQIWPKQNPAESPKIHLRISGNLNPTAKVACIFFMVFSFIKAFFLRQSHMVPCGTEHVSLNKDIKQPTLLQTYCSPLLSPCNDWLNSNPSLTSFQGWLPPLPHNFPFPWQALGRSVASRCRPKSFQAFLDLYRKYNHLTITHSKWLLHKNVSSK